MYLCLLLVLGLGVCENIETQHESKYMVDKNIYIEYSTLSSGL